MWCYSLVMAIGFFTNFTISCMDGFHIRCLGFYVKHEIKKSRESLRNRMDYLKRLQQEQQEAMNKRKKELEEKINEQSNSYLN